MKRNKLVAPILKWVGGKRQLIESIEPLLPPIKNYCEPFVGGGALLFHLQPKVAYINDVNEELIRTYRVIRDNVSELISLLESHKNEVDYFYEIRDWDRDNDVYSKLTDIERAARIIYLNKTCYNGLFRVNSSGEFNTPFGYYKNPNIVNAPTLRAVSAYFNSAKIEITSIDYEEVLARIPKNTFVYLDPPYDPISDTSSFTGYSKGGFNRDEQLRLKNCCDALNKRGIKFMQSNSSTDFIKNLYSAYDISYVKAKRAVNSDSAKRGEVEEVIIRNYGE